MKVRTIKYIFNEGVKNVYKNRLMSLASISTITASLIIFGIFYLIIANINHNIMKLKEQPEMQVFCNPELDDMGVKLVQNALIRNSNIAEVTMVTKEEAFEKIKEMLDEDADLLEGLDSSFLPVSFIIKLKDIANSGEVVKELKKINGVDKVTYPQKTMEIISKFTNWIHVISIVLTAILLIISVFIISNTIKLTVFARRKEISIMKYIGATNWFIRWPFIVEGILIGFIGAAVSFVISGFFYNRIENRFTQELIQAGTDIITLLKFNEINLPMLVMFMFLGCTVGAFGSIISIRRYLKV
ncbi:MAG TPA: ABC transporter permease [Clostridiaceae bacterium]|nr:ABC transporter permease [Clostridiaceae bacterium]